MNVGAAVTDLSPRELDVLFTRYASQVHTNSQSETHLFYWLNTFTAGFDDLDVQRALNYAVDRRRGARARGWRSPRAAQTCQIMPPNFPGYRPYCPYTADAGPGRPWTAPDLLRARRLIARSHTRGMHRLKVWAPAAGLDDEAGFLRALARQAFGYRASLRLIPRCRVLRAYRGLPPSRTSRERFSFSTIADYPAARDLLQGFFELPRVHSG